MKTKLTIRNIDLNLFKALKIRAVEEDLSIGQLLNKVIFLYLNKGEKND